MVWGGISAQAKTPLFIIRGNLNSERYLREVLETHVVPVMNHHTDITVFQHDNARPHTAAICRNFLQQQRIDVLPWPARSPDLSPIEHLWDLLGRRVKARGPQTVQELEKYLIEEWNSIPQNKISNLIKSMRRRVLCVVEANGAHTRY